MKEFRAGHRWLIPVILATQGADIRRIMVQNQPQANSSRDPNLKKNLSQKRAGGVAQGVSPEFKCQNCQKKKKSRIRKANIT
jgi:hypothetical protein